MKDHPEINWDKLIEQSLRSHLEQLERNQEITNWKEKFILNFCGVIKGEIEEIDNIKEIWAPKLE